jgi:hypothetical protein
MKEAHASTATSNYFLARLAVFAGLWAGPRALPLSRSACWTPATRLDDRMNEDTLREVLTSDRTDYDIEAPPSTLKSADTN